MKWFRFYHEFVDDPKIAMMSDSDQLMWVKALCLASDSNIRGTITLSDEEVCWKLRCTMETWKHAIDKFRAKGMIEHSRDGYIICNWEKRQYKTDDVKSRVSKHRAKKKTSKKAEGASVLEAETEPKRDCNVTVTPPEQNRSDSDQIRSELDPEQIKTPAGNSFSCEDQDNAFKSKKYFWNEGERKNGDIDQDFLSFLEKEMDKPGMAQGFLHNAKIFQKQYDMCCAYWRTFESQKPKQTEDSLRAEATKKALGWAS